jgi:hypothetical protein
MIQRLLNSFGVTQLNGLTSNFNNLRDEIYGHFYRSQNQLRSSGDQLFSAGQRFPYFALTDATRAEVSQGISTLLQQCSKPTTDFLGRQSTLPLFDYPNNSTSPIEAALKPVTDKIKEINDQVAKVTDIPCLRSLQINSGRINSLFNSVTNAVNGCIRTLSTNVRSSINDFTSAHFQALPAVNRLYNDLQACAIASNQNRESCAMKIGRAVCTDEDPACVVCNSL